MTTPARMIAAHQGIGMVHVAAAVGRPDQQEVGELIVLSGRSGTGKSSIARALASKIGAVWLRIDSIEQAVRDADVLRNDIGAAGYLAAHAVASDNLEIGRTVIADCVNGWMLTRDAWRDVGLSAGAEVFEVELVCSDVEEHRRRVETRLSDVPGLRLPSWSETMARDYHPWDRDHIMIDTARLGLDASVAILQAALEAYGLAKNLT